MPFFVVILLGLIQGLTEFIPVSSSGHLVIAQHYLPFFSAVPLSFDVMLHFGTLISLIIYFFKDIKEIVLAFFDYKSDEAARNRRLAYYIIIGSIPAGIVGIVFKDQIEALFSNIGYIPYMLFITAILLLIGEWTARPEGQEKPIGLKHSLIIGLFQAVAIIPGISRSGSTISGGLMSGVGKREAARFSFLLSIPAVFGAFILSVGDISGFDSSYIIGMAAACLVGLAAIWLTMKFVMAKKLWIFSVYLIILGAVLLAINLL